MLCWTKSENVACYGKPVEHDLDENMNDHSKWIRPGVFGMITSSLLIILVTTLVAHIEFHHAKWTHSPRNLPTLAEIFKNIYSTAWLLSVVTAVVGGLVWTRRLKNEAAIVWLASLLSVSHLAWLLFTFLALYLTNQTFVAK